MVGQSILLRRVLRVELVLKIPVEDVRFWSNLSNEEFLFKAIRQSLKSDTINILTICPQTLTESNP